MDQAIADAGLGESDITNERTGIIMGSGGPSTRTIVEAAETTLKNSSPKRIGPFAVPKAMSSTASATLATWFKIHGVNYSISSACSTSAHCIGNAYELIQWGKQDIDVRRRPRGSRLDDVGPVRRHGRHVVEVQRPGLGRHRAPMTPTATASSSPAAPACWSSRNWSTPRRAAPRSTPRSSATARPRTATTWWHHRAKARSAACARRWPRLPAPVDYINTHGTSTPVGDSKEMGAIREVFGEKMPIHHLDQVADRPFAGAAGVQESIYSILMMQGGFIGESAHIEDLDPEFEGMPIVRKRIDNAKIDTVLSNSFGFGGTNATLVFQRLFRIRQCSRIVMDGLMKGKRGPCHGRRQRSFDRLGHRQAACRTGRGACLHLSGRGLRPPGQAACRKARRLAGRALRCRGQRVGHLGLRDPRQRLGRAWISSSMPSAFPTRTNSRAFMPTPAGTTSSAPW